MQVTQGNKIINNKQKSYLETLLELYCVWMGDWLIVGLEKRKKNGL